MYHGRGIGIVVFFLLVTISFPPSGVSVEKTMDVLPAIEYVYPDQSIWTIKRDSTGILENPLLKFSEAVFTELNIPWTAKPFPANRMFERLETGRSNFSILVQASRLKESCIFSSKPVTFSELRVYRKKTVSPINTIEDFRKKSVILIRGYSYGKIGAYLRNTSNGVATYEAPKHEAAFKMLNFGRAEYLLDYSGPSEEVLSQYPIEGVTHDLMTRLNVYFVLSRHYPNAEEMMIRFERAADGIDITQWGLESP